MTTSIWLLNLDRAPERLEFMTEQLARLGLEARRFAAVDGREVGDDVLHERATKGAMRVPMVRGSQAIAVSTYRIFKDFIETGTEFALILQDDVELSDDLARFVMDTGWVPETTGLVQLEHRGRERSIKLFGKRTPSPCDGRELCVMQDRHLGAGCFLIRRSFAQFLVERDDKLDMPIDQFLFNPANSQVPHLANALVVHPALAHQLRDELGSDLEADRRTSFGELRAREGKLGRIRREAAQAWRHLRGMCTGGRLMRTHFSKRPEKCSCTAAKKPDPLLCLGHEKL